MKKYTYYKDSLKHLNGTIKGLGAGGTSARSGTSARLAHCLKCHKEAELRVLNTTILKDKCDFRNPMCCSTFGNPYLNEKFNTKVYLKELVRS